ncbi:MULTISPECIES: MCE family protein [Nocardioides]|uniref:MCE family protein n=1 Tax=Nocardioides vastitatis TaxID=2568655 RepID=A0ABW0ZSD1_9ACTN|nr:MlaD family protein [Nocardioides sp.]THJ16025.1 MCE family protein [Nocardioides sp.]
MKLSVERRRQRADLVKLSAFLALAAVVTVWVAAVTGEYRPDDRETYAAVFDGVSGLSPGDDVRIAGVDVGKVEEMDVQDDNTVRVTFNVRDDQELTTATHATIQYRNLTGDRIVLLTQGRDRAQVLDAGGTIPVSQTASALDLDSLLNGFRPLFAGLGPSAINELAGQVVQVLQGQQSAVAALVDHVASVTTTIGSREELIGQVIRNLNSVLGTVDENSGSLGELIDGLDALLVGLDKQDTQLLDAAAEIDRFARETTALLTGARGDARDDLAALLVAARGLNRKSATLEQVLAALARHYPAMQSTASYGNFYNTFICGIRVQTDLGTGPWIHSDARRCRR